MKKAFQIIGICALTCFSFYYTDKVVEVARNKDPIMEEIVSRSSEVNVKSVNAEINDNTIRSGVSSMVVDTNKSYQKMKSLGEYNDNLLVFKEEAPVVSIKDNYDKFVVGGNSIKRNISICFTISDKDYILSILDILKKNKVVANIFLDGIFIEDNPDIVKKIIKDKHYIGNLGYGGVYDNTRLKYVNSLIYRYSDYISKYCYSSNEEDLSFCSKNKMYTIKGIDIDKNYPYTSLKENLSNGIILRFSDNKETVKDLDLMLKYVKHKGYNIENLDDLLTE